MNAYETLRNNYLTEVATLIPSLDGDTLTKLGNALDRVAYGFEVSQKETALSTAVEVVPPMVQTYIVVKKTEGLSNGTLKNYADALVRFFNWCHKSPETVTANDIRMYLYEYSTQHKVSDRTLDKYRAYICWFFSWAYNEEYLSKNPAKSIKAIKHEIKERQALSQLDLEYLRMACKTIRDRAILETLYSTGCRVSELIQLKKDDVNWSDGTVHLFGKGRKHRTGYLNAKAIVALKEYLKNRTDDNQYLFVSDRAPYHPVRKETIEYTIRKLAADSGLGKKVTPHILRHTTATQAVNAGMPIEDVSKLLGHASINTTMIYAKPAVERVQAEHLRCVV